MATKEEVDQAREAYTGGVRSGGPYGVGGFVKMTPIARVFSQYWPGNRAITELTAPYVAQKQLGMDMLADIWDDPTNDMVRWVHPSYNYMLSNNAGDESYISSDDWDGPDGLDPGSASGFSVEIAPSESVMFTAYLSNINFLNYDNLPGDWSNVRYSQFPQNLWCEPAYSLWGDESGVYYYLGQGRNTVGNPHFAAQATGAGFWGQTNTYSFDWNAPISAIYQAPSDKRGYITLPFYDRFLDPDDVMVLNPDQGAYGSVSFSLWSMSRSTKG